jgi:Uma2 family endonuclease
MARLDLPPTVDRDRADIPRTYPFAVADFQRMYEVGILPPETRAELIEGAIVEMSPIGARHAGCVNRLSQLFWEVLAGTAIISVQNSVRLNDRNLPQPDVALLTPRADFYGNSHPTPEDVLLIVEVAETTVRFDRDTKGPLYAIAGIREYWLVDLAANLVEVYRNPSDSGYRTKLTVEAGEMIAPVALPDRAIAVAAMLGTC